MRRLIVGISGGSCIQLAIKTLEILKAIPDIETHLVYTNSSLLTLKAETDITEEQLCSLADVVYENSRIGEAPASGTFETIGMLVVPCSMKTVAGINSGFSDNLLLRAADVTIKEQRPLVLCVRETPLSSIHLRNLHELSMVNGVHIIPPMMTFYNHPENIDDMLNHIAAKLLEPFKINTPYYKRWEGIK